MMVEIGFIIVLGILGGLLIANQIIHSFERRDLLNRLMARDLPELMTWENEQIKTKMFDKIPKKKDPYVNL